jgi:hypothetical protein
MSVPFKDKFHARQKNGKDNPQPVSLPSQTTTTSTPSTIVRTEQVVKYQTNPFVTLLLTISIGLNILLFPIMYVSWQFMGSPEYAVWVARNRTHVVLDENMVRRHEQYYKNVEQLLRNRK